MRIKESKISFQFAKLLLDLVGISEKIREISEEVEEVIKEQNGYDYCDEDEYDNRQRGWSYHQIDLLSEYEPQVSIDGILTEQQIKKLCEFSNEGNLKVDVGVLNILGSSHEWSIDLTVPKNPHFTTNEKISIQINLSYLVGYELGGQIKAVFCDINEDELAKIYTAYSLVHL